MVKTEAEFARLRVSGYPNQKLEVSRFGKLRCTVCNEGLDAEKASTVRSHVYSNKHKQNLAVIKTTPSVSDSFDDCMWEDMLKIFLGSGVPIFIFRTEKVRNWFKKNVKSGHTLPSESSLRRMVTKMAEKDETETIEWLKEKDVIVMADETTDLLNRKVLHVLVAPAAVGGHFRIAATKILHNECNSSVVFNAIVEAMSKMQVSPDRVVCLKSDNAPYMIAAGRTLAGFYPRLIHSTCWSHIIHLVGEEIRTKFKTADSYIAAFKASLVKAPNRRQKLLEVFKQKDLPQKLPPVPVITRWATWVKTGSFHFRHLEAELEWISGADSSASAALAKLKKLAKKENLRTELEKIDQICETIASTLITLETNGLPASDVWLQLKVLDGAVKEVFGVTSSKLSLYMTSKHPAKDYWEQCRYFDPRKADEVIGNGPEKIPIAVQNFDTTGVSDHELFMYKQIRKTQNYDAAFSPFKFWNSFKRELPTLSDIAIRALSLPCSSAEVERSFSALKRLLTPQRASFTEENLSAHTKLMFNQKCATVEEDLNLVSSDEDE